MDVCISRISSTHRMTLQFASAHRYDPKKAFKKKIWVLTTHKKCFRAHEVQVCGKLKLSFWSLLNKKRVFSLPHTWTSCARKQFFMSRYYFCFFLKASLGSYLFTETNGIVISVLTCRAGTRAVPCPCRSFAARNIFMKCKC